jgi:hypothetical protein
LRHRLLGSVKLVEGVSDWSNDWLLVHDGLRKAVRWQRLAKYRLSENEWVIGVPVAGMIGCLIDRYGERLYGGNAWPGILLVALSSSNRFQQRGRHVVFFPSKRAELLRFIACGAARVAW